MIKRMKRSANRAMGVFSLIVALGIGLSGQPAFCQEQEIRPVTVGDPMPDFTLPTYQGGSQTLSSLRGKNVMIIFPRGYAAEGAWCTICNYKYAELIDVEKKEELRKAYDLEILIILPYSGEIVKQWVDVVPDQLEKIKSWKNPPEPDKLDEKGKARMERSRKGFPLDLAFEKGHVPTPFPILIDEERKVTKGLGLFATEWSGSKVDQVIPSVFIIDKEGRLAFKYIGQNTWDRPSLDYLKRILRFINASR